MRACACVCVFSVLFSFVLLLFLLFVFEHMRYIQLSLDNHTEALQMQQFRLWQEDAFPNSQFPCGKDMYSQLNVAI